MRVGDGLEVDVTPFHVHSRGALKEVAPNEDNKTFATVTRNHLSDQKVSICVKCYFIFSFPLTILANQL